MTDGMPAKADLDALPSTFDRIADAMQGGLRPETDLTVTQWAEANRTLGGRGDPEPGPYRIARTPYIREIADALSPAHPAQRVTLMKGSQIGGTEAGNCWLGYIIANAPGPIIAVQPTVQLAKRFSKQRIEPLIAGAAVLREKVRPPRARDSGNTILQKDFPGGVLVMTGANSAVGLRSMTARYAFLDEVDGYPGNADDEGDPIALAEARTKTYGFRRKIYLCSTPKLAKSSRITAEYEASDQRRFFVPCPHCLHMQWLRFEQLRWQTGRPETAAYYCEACGGAATEGDKTDMLARGEWRPTATPANPLWIGFHISSLYSPVGWISWADIAGDFEKARAMGPGALQTFKNSMLGEPWQDQGEAPEWERLLERREPFPMGVVPRRAAVLSAAVDNQASPARLEFALWGWAPGYESWLIETREISGDPAGREAWDAVRELLDTDWPREGGGTMRIATMAVDTGGQHTAGIYAQLRRLRDPRIVPIKGVPGWNKASPVNGPSQVDVTVSGRKIKRGLKLWTVSVDVFKADLYRRFWLTRDDETSYPPGWVHLPDGLDVERVKQLVAEELVSKKDRRGFTRYEWQKRRANEQLDLAVYARAALTVLGSDRYGERFWSLLDRWKEDEPELPMMPNDVPMPVLPADMPDPSPRASRSTAERAPARTKEPAATKQDNPGGVGWVSGHEQPATPAPGVSIAAVNGMSMVSVKKPTEPAPTEPGLRIITLDDGKQPKKRSLASMLA